MTVRPALLRPDNFASPARTPWGGTRILDYKRDLALPERPAIVGEAWEISVEPSLPSRLAATGELLAEVVARDPVAWLGAGAARRFDGQTPMLVKLLDARAPLSVQVHPRDDDPGLAPGESGKLECWVVLEADPGARIWLGLADGVGRPELERALAAEDDLSRLLAWTAVGPGDVFVLPAGVPHAIGAGVTLIEPQLVRPRCRGLTYRFWDWNRRYDAAGRESPAGTPRALQIERALAVTDYAFPRGAAGVAALRRIPRTLEQAPGIARRRLVDGPWLIVDEWRGTGTLALPSHDSLVGLLAVGGRTTITGETGSIDLPCGQSAVVPTVAGRLVVAGRDTHVVATSLPR